MSAYCGSDRIGWSFDGTVVVATNSKQHHRLLKRYRVDSLTFGTTVHRKVKDFQFPQDSQTEKK